MRVRVGQISAHCEQCGCEDFQPTLGEPSCAADPACFNCGLSSTRMALLTQISDESVRRAQALLDASRKARQ